MKAIVVCEYSGIVRESLKKRGWEAWSCDLLDTEIPGNHYKGDARDVLNDGWDLMIAHPPCTYMANSGVQHLHRSIERWISMFEDAKLFSKLFNAPITYKALENPIMHKYAKQLIGCGDPSQIIQPWQFGHGETKATCLWLKNLPKLKPTKIVDGREQRIWKMPPTKDPEERRKARSKTYAGIAEAMADQWTKYIKEQVLCKTS